MQIQLKTDGASFDGGLAVVNNFITGRALLSVGGGVPKDNDKKWYTSPGLNQIYIRTINDSVTPNNYARKILKDW